MGTAHAGPITHSRKKNEAARQIIDVVVIEVIEAGITKAAASKKPGAATMRRAMRAFPVRLKIRSDSEPPAMSPAIPANNGTEAQSPSAARDRWRCSRR